MEASGGRAILMASRALVAAAGSADDYLDVYGGLIRQAAEPVILHWLGDMFDPSLAGYWGSRDVDAATETVLTLIREHAARIDGIKISLLDENREIALRRRLPPGVKMFTGDDFNYARLIEGDGEHHSHALLGIFDPIAPAAAAALQALGGGDVAAFRAALEPTVPLSRKIFESPTQYYKAGVVFLAWLNGHQDHFAMVGGMQSARSALHYAEVFRLADRAQAAARPGARRSRMAQPDGAARDRVTADLRPDTGEGARRCRELRPTGSASRIAGRGRPRRPMRSSRRSSRPGSRGTSRWRPSPCRPSTSRSPSRR